MPRVACFLLVAAWVIAQEGGQEPIDIGTTITKTVEGKVPQTPGQVELNLNSTFNVSTLSFLESDKLSVSFWTVPPKLETYQNKNPEQAVRNLLSKSKKSKLTNRDKSELTYLMSKYRSKFTLDDAYEICAVLLSQGGTDWAVGASVGGHYVMVENPKAKQLDGDKLALYDATLKAQAQNTGNVQTTVFSEDAGLALGLLEPDGHGAKIEIVPGTKLVVTREFIPAKQTILSKDLKYSLQLMGKPKTNAGVKSFNCDDKAVIIEAGELHQHPFTCTLETNEQFSDTVLELSATLVPDKGRVEYLPVPIKEVTVQAKPKAAPEPTQVDTWLKRGKDNAGWIGALIFSWFVLGVPWWIEVRKRKGKKVGLAIEALGKTLEETQKEKKAEDKGEDEQKEKSAVAGQ